MGRAICDTWDLWKMYVPMLQLYGRGDPEPAAWVASMRNISHEFHKSVMVCGWRGGILGYINCDVIE